MGLLKTLKKTKRVLSMLALGFVPDLHLDDSQAKVKENENKGERETGVKLIPKKFVAAIIILGIIIIWIALELGIIYLLTSLFGESDLVIIIIVGITFVIGAYFFFAIKKVWKKFR